MFISFTNVSATVFLWLHNQHHWCLIITAKTDAAVTPLGYIHYECMYGLVKKSQNRLGPPKHYQLSPSSTPSPWKLFKLPWPFVPCSHSDFRLNAPVLLPTALLTIVFSIRVYVLEGCLAECSPTGMLLWSEYSQNPLMRQLWNWGKCGSITGWSPDWVSPCEVNPGFRRHILHRSDFKVSLCVQGDTSTLSDQKPDREAVIAVVIAALNWVTARTNTNSPIVKWKRSLFDCSSEFKKTVSDWKMGAHKRR